MSDNEEYGAESIKVLEGTEGIRKRPSMYIGDTGERGLHHLVYEVIDNSIDEAMAGRGTQVEVTIHKDNSISVRDDGAGIPAAMHPEYNVPTLEVILTKLHSGGKFDDKAYKVSGGLHGVGLAAVCALSEDFLVKSYRDGKIYTQTYSEGKKTTDVTEEPLNDEPHGTLIKFKPDTTIFSPIEFNYNYLAGRFKELAFLTNKFKIIFNDERPVLDINGIPVKDDRGNFTYNSDIFYAEGGIKAFVEASIGAKERILPQVPIFYSFAEIEGNQIEVAMTYTDSYQETLKGFVNNINTHEGGTHVTGLKTVITRTINNFGRDFKILKDKEKLSGNDVREGIIAIVSVKVPDPMFEGQTKTKLGNSEIDGYVQTAVGQPLTNWLVDNQDMGKAIINKAVLARRAREAAKKAKELIRKNSSGRVNLPGKLVSSRTKDPMKRELYLVEGQSAGGTAVKARDNEFQEVLFLRGKVLNVEKARLNRALENAEIRNIITALNTGINEDFDLSKCRYGKVILLTDADVDGAHIATLLFTFFYRYMKPLIEDGRLYIARPPLFKVGLRAKAAKMTKNKNIYLYKDRDLEALLYGFQNMDITNKDFTINRFKGLGEMNADQLGETSMELTTRTIDKVTINDDLQSEEWLVNLMGENVEPRKEFIKNQVFKETGLEKRGQFYEIAFSEMVEQDDDMVDDEEFDEFDPEKDFLDALENFEF